MVTSTPSKLFKLKKWLTLPEAAKHLSVVCGEEVAIADILRLALDGYLTLSVNFVNKAHARPGQVVGEEGIIWYEFSPIWRGLIPDLPSEDKDLPLEIPKSLYIEDGKYLNLEEKVVSIDDIWDLPMIGNEQIDIEHEYQRLTGGPSVDLIGLDGAFVQKNSGEMYQLQESFDDHYGHKAARQAQSEKIRRLKLNKTNNKRKEQLLKLREEKLKKLNDIYEKWMRYDQYYPAGGLPSNCVLVVRTDALRDFEQFLSDSENESKAPSSSVKPHGNTERFAQNREQVLGAALSVLTRWPELCQNSSGKVEATKLANLIDEKALLFWPETGTPPLGRGKMEREISKWINKTGK